jgi:hypothetical protein
MTCWKEDISRKAAKLAKNDRKKGFAAFAALREKLSATCTIFAALRINIKNQCDKALIRQFS